MGNLHRFLRQSKHAEAQAEIDGGADVNELVGMLSPIEEAIHYDDVAMVALLIRAGADVNQGHPKTGRRPLHSAAIKSDLRIMQLLLDAGADIEGCRETSTPLCMAAQSRNRAGYDLLLNAGANPLATMRGRTAAELVVSAVAEFDQAIEWFARISKERKPDQWEPVIRKMMGEYPTVEEYAAHRGSNIYMYSFDLDVFTDPAVQEWAQELGRIIRSPERLMECQEQFLTGRDLDRARRHRRHVERRQAREEARKEGIALAAERDLLEY